MGNIECTLFLSIYQIVLYLHRDRIFLLKSSCGSSARSNIRSGSKGKRKRKKWGEEL